MKPPLRVEAKVAEELRNWLASELEQLDASNINQFAHHVVTILLREDLDIEDEPLSAEDDFLTGMHGMRKGKTREKQKKAAVQFLRNAVCCDAPVESEIQSIVDELMVRIEATKLKKSTKKSSRSLLAPITVNTENKVVQSCAERNSTEEERRYNEAFPSLPNDEIAGKDVSDSGVNLHNSVWNTSPPGKENSSMSRKHRRHANTTVTFVDQKEAEVMAIVRRVFAAAVNEDALPYPEALEILPNSLGESLPSHSSSSFSCVRPSSPIDESRCWKSAFYAPVPTKLFFPIKGPVHGDHPQIATTVAVKYARPTIIENSWSSLNGRKDLSQFVDLFSSESPKVFLPVSEVEKVSTVDVEPQYPSAQNEYDLEVANIIAWAQINESQMKRKMQNFAHKPKREVKDEVPTKKTQNEIQCARCFSNHYGDFWSDILQEGRLFLYPCLGNGCLCQRDMANNMQSTSGNDGSAVTLEETGTHSSREMIQNRNLDTSDTTGCERASVTFTDDILSFALQELADMNFDDGDHHNSEDLVESSLGAAEDHWYEVETTREDLIESTDLAASSERALIASSDSGILLAQGAEEDVYLQELFASAPAGHALSWQSREAEFQWHKERNKMQGRNNEFSYLGPEENFVEIPCEPYISASSVESDCLYTKRSDLGLDNHMEDLTLGLAEQAISSDQSPSNNESAPYFSVENPPVVWMNPLAQSKWDSIRQYIFTTSVSYEEAAVSFQPTSTSNRFMPSLFQTCLSDSVAQMLQSAYVNSFFSGSPKESIPLTTVELQQTPKALTCEALENAWLSVRSTLKSDVNTTVVRGRTCSKWLENTCSLGLSCPFSHPSI